MIVHAHRFYFTLTNGSAVRIQAHKDDPTKIVVKSPDKHAVDCVVETLGVDIGVEQAFQGHNYFIVVCDRAKFFAALPAFADTIGKKVPFSAQAPEDDAEPAENPASAYDGDGDSDEASEEPPPPTGG